MVAMTKMEKEKFNKEWAETVKRLKDSKTDLSMICITCNETEVTDFE